MRSILTKVDDPYQTNRPHHLPTFFYTYGTYRVKGARYRSRKVGHPTSPTPCLDGNVLGAWQGLKPPTRPTIHCLDNSGVFHSPAHTELGARALGSGMVLGIARCEGALSLSLRYFVEYYEEKPRGSASRRPVESYARSTTLQRVNETSSRRIYISGKFLPVRQRIRASSTMEVGNESGSGRPGIPRGTRGLLHPPAPIIA